MDTAQAGKYASSHHRVRLTDEDLDLITTALRQYASGKTSDAKKAHARELIDRMIERRPGRH
jgi:hypothetical protein